MGEISNDISSFTQERGHTNALSVARLLLKGEVSNNISAFTQERSLINALRVARALLIRDILKYISTFTLERLYHFTRCGESFSTNGYLTEISINTQGRT